MKAVKVGDMVVEQHRGYVVAYLPLPGMSECARVQAFGLPDGNLWDVRPCSLRQEEREAIVDRVRATMRETGIELPRLSRQEAARRGRVMPQSDRHVGS
jgi:hypothetical protein